MAKVRGPAPLRDETIACALCGIIHRAGATTCDGCGRSLLAPLDPASIRAEYSTHSARALVGTIGFAGLVAVDCTVVASGGAVIASISLFLALVSLGVWTITQWNRRAALRRHFTHSQ